ncbi:hypothetical protein LPJ70_006023, partial [Coemansia sp. RSA 2708]
MLTTSVPSYILSSGLAAQRSRPRSRRLSHSSDASSINSSISSLHSSPSDDEVEQMADESLSEIKEVLGYVHTSRRWAQQCDVPRL